MMLMLATTLLIAFLPSPVDTVKVVGKLVECTPEICGIRDADVRWLLKESDEAYVALLDPAYIPNLDDWRRHYSEQVYGFGVRSVWQQLSQPDLDQIRPMFLDASSYEPRTLSCGVSGDAAVRFRSRFGEVTVVLELCCNRLHYQGMSPGCWELAGNFAPIQDQVRSLVRRYFPDDPYFRDTLGMDDPK